MKLDELTTTDSKLRRQGEAIRLNKISVGLAFLYLAGYEVELHYIGKPNASAAKEVIDELNYETQTAIYSVSTRDGGVWERWERDAIFYGRVDATNSYAVWERRLADYPA